MKFLFEPVEAFVAVREPGAEPLVLSPDDGAVIPAGGTVAVYGAAGVGKTTLVNDLTFKLSAGLCWCGVLRPVRPLRVLVIENEGPRPMMRAKLAAKLATVDVQPEGRIIVLDEPWARFDFRDEDCRSELAAAVDAERIDLLVAGPVSKLGMEGGGTADEIESFMRHVRTVQEVVADPLAVLLVHHENRAGQVSGAWEPIPDTLIHVQGQGQGRTRVYWQKARWASDLHATTIQLLWEPGESFTVEAKPEITEDTIERDILAAVGDAPGGSWSKIRAAVTGNTTQAANVRDRLLSAGVLVNRPARQGHRPHRGTGRRAS